MKRIALVLVLTIPTAVLADDPVFNVSPGFRVATVATDEKYDPGIPKESTKYKSAQFTQSISVLNERDTILSFPIGKMSDKRWHQPGGLEGIKGWRSERYRLLPKGQRIRYWVGNVEVENSIPTGRRKSDGTPEFYRQNNRAILRAYPDGTRFDELLINDKTGVVFEHRIREKENGKWQARVEHKDESARPEGYTGLKVSCSSCHNEAGTGKYNEGLVPGGDTILGDPLNWRIWTYQPPEEATSWQPLPLSSPPVACAT